MPMIRKLPRRRHGMILKSFPAACFEKHVVEIYLQQSKRHPESPLELSGYSKHFGASTD
jgi:hypothetical protein